MLTASHLREILEYDAVTGVFNWRRRSDRSNSWNTRYAGTVASGLAGAGYSTLSICKRPYYQHRLAFLYMTGSWPSAQVDHIDRDKRNNAWSNLRPASQSENCRNTGPNSRSQLGIKGVSYLARTKRFSAKIFISGKNKHLGYFATAVEAQDAYLTRATELFGPFARAA